MHIPQHSMNRPFKKTSINYLYTFLSFREGIKFFCDGILNLREGITKIFYTFLSFWEGINFFREGILSFREGITKIFYTLLSSREGIKFFREGFANYREGINNSQEGLKIVYGVFGFKNAEITQNQWFSIMTDGQ